MNMILMIECDLPESGARSRRAFKARESSQTSCLACAQAANSISDQERRDLIGAHLAEAAARCGPYTFRWLRARWAQSVRLLRIRALLTTCRPAERGH